MAIKVTYVTVVVAAAMTAALIGQATAHAETIVNSFTRDGWASGQISAQIDECKYVYMSVYGNESTDIRGKWQTTNNAIVLIDLYTCPALTGTWEHRYGYAEFDGAFVPPNSRLVSAATDELIISETCDDFGRCSPAHISVQATWTGLGNIARWSLYHNNDNFGPYHFVSIFKGISREAAVAVELKINDVAVPIEIESYAPLCCSLGRARSGSLEITHN